MALIKCPECGQEISDQSKNCIHCGFPLKSRPHEQKRGLIIAALILIFLLSIFVGIKVFSPNQSENLDNLPSDDSNAVNSSVVTPTPTPVVTPTPNIEDLIVDSRINIQPYLDVMGADITNGNPPVSQEFIDNLDSVEIMGCLGSIVHGYNIYGDKTYSELATWESNHLKSNDDFYEFLGLMNEYFGQKGALVSYDYIDDEIYGWVEPSHKFSIITYFDDGKIFLQWDVKLDFEDDETLNYVESSKDDYTPSYSTKCIECGANASYTYTNPFSGKIEDYCYTHYQEILDIVDMMEEDVGDSSYSKRTCEECSREGTHRYDSFTGQTEYYCTTHYNELMEMLTSFGIE